MDFNNRAICYQILLFDIPGWFIILIDSPLALLSVNNMDRRNYSGCEHGSVWPYLYLLQLTAPCVFGVV